MLGEMNEPTNVTVSHFHEEAVKNPVAVDYLLTRSGLRIVTADDFQGYQSYQADWTSGAITIVPRSTSSLGVSVLLLS